MNLIEIAKAKDLHEKGNAKGLYKFIKKYLDQNDPYAKYFYSTISLTEWNESQSQQDSRRIKLLIEAADNDVPEAAYQLACCYLSGDCVEMNWETAIIYTERAVRKNYEPAKIMYSQLHANNSK